MKSSKKSRAEIQRAYRQRLLEKNADEVRERERRRWHQRCGLNKVQKINNMTEREKRTLALCDSLEVAEINFK